jgi:glycosyltransferase involved in cell wall biosynthesis
MNVVHFGVGGAIPVPPGELASGTERYIFHLTDHLAQLGCQVSVIDIKGGAPQKGKRQGSAAKFYEVWHPPLRWVYRFPFWPRFFAYLLLMAHLFFFAVPAAFSFWKLSGKRKVEILHLHSSLPALAAIMVNKLRGNTAVTIYTMHTGFGTAKLGWRRKLPALPEILAIKWADHIIAPSPAVKRWLVSELDQPPGKITQIYTSADVAEAADFLSREATSRKSNMVLCVGGVSSRKNQLNVVKAISTVAAVCPDVRFVFAGIISEPAYFEAIQKFVSENSLKRWVEFTGEVSREKIFSLYGEAALFLFPTRAEAQGLVVAEAMAFGLPVIASNIEPIADMECQEEGSAILLDPDDVEGIAAAVSRLLQDRSLRESMSAKGKRLAQRFSHRHIAGEMLALYTRLVQDKARVAKDIAMA